MSENWQVYVEEVENGYIISAERGCAKDVKEFVARNSDEVRDILWNQVGDLMVGKYGNKQEKTEGLIPWPADSDLGYTGSLGSYNGC